MISPIQYIFINAAWLRWLWALIIFALCAMPGDYIPSANWLELLSFDKLVHAGIFFILTTFFLLPAKGIYPTKASVVLIVVICILYGASLEWMQAHFFRHRSSDWKDIIANSTGCVIALMTYRKIIAKVSRIIAP